MIDLMTNLNAPPAQSIEWLQWLLDVSLKGALILLAAGALSLLLRRTSAATRHLVWAFALLSLLILMPLTLTLPEWRVSLLPSLLVVPQVETETADEVVLKDLAAPGSEGIILAYAVQNAKPAVIEQPMQKAATSLLPASQALPFHWSHLALLIWLIGAVIVLARVASATIRVWALTREAEYLIDYQWTTTAKRLEAQLQLRVHIPLLKSQYVRMPMTWGILSPVVLVPAEADEWSIECKKIVLLHEMAHIRRCDCLTQILSHMACALQWFNPLVWLAARRLRIERELACDDYVLRVGTRASDYASYLVDMAGSVESVSGTPQVAVGMACSHLESRVQAILDPTVRRLGLSQRFKALVVLLTFCLILPLAALEPWTDAAAQQKKKKADPSAAPIKLPRSQGKANSDDAAKKDRQKLLAESSIETTQLIEAEELNIEPELAAEQSGLELQDAKLAQVLTEIEAAFEVSSEEAVIQSDELQATQLRSPRSKQRVREVQKRERQLQARMRKEQRKMSHELRGRSFAKGFGRIHGLAMAQGSGQSSELTVENIILLKLRDVTPEFIEAMRRAGYDNLSAQELVQLHMYGVNEEFAKEAKALIGEKPSVRDLVELKLRGVTPDYIREMKKAGYDLEIKSLTKLSMFGVTPEFVAAMKKLGYDNLTAEQLTNLKMHGVTESYVKEMREAGFDKLTVEELIMLKKYEVTPDYVKKLRAAGLKNVSMNQLIEMKLRGIDKILLKN
ncbi:MAG: M56 family metallopeptidase [Acidobacteria bacterium]|nr:M56 family metallopeptidase [Acidobacteriota bacterium]